MAFNRINIKDFENLDNVVIDKMIFEAHFACDLSKCKGICCVIKGTLGAPITLEEINIIDKIIPDITSYFEKPKLDYMYSNGFYEKFGDNYYLKTLNGDDCLFSYYDSDIAKCIFQKAYLDKQIDFKKPISCDLFPIRMYKGDKIYLKYEKISECKSAIIYGNDKKIRLFDFVRDALVRVFGSQFVDKIKNNFVILE